MKLMGFAICVSLAAATTSLAAPFTVLPKNRPLSLKLIEYRFQTYLLQAPTDAEYTDLKGEALVYWCEADPIYRNFWKMNLEGQKVLIVGSYLPDRGDYCFYYFNSDGEYLNSFCGGNDRRWAWND